MDSDWSSNMAKILLNIPKGIVLIPTNNWDDSVWLRGKISGLRIMYLIAGVCFWGAVIYRLMVFDSYFEIIALILAVLIGLVMIYFNLFTIWLVISPAGITVAQGILNFKPSEVLMQFSQGENLTAESFVAYTHTKSNTDYYDIRIVRCEECINLNIVTWIKKRD